jgi:hypothetical protein
MEKFDISRGYGCWHDRSGQAKKIGAAESGALLDWARVQAVTRDELRRLTRVGWVLDPDRLIVAITSVELSAYLDASGGADKGQPTVAFAGLLSSGRRWGRFCRDWSTPLIREGLPPFHASEFFGQRGSFFRLADDTQERVLSDLTKAVNKHVRFAFGGAVHARDFDQLSPESKRVFRTEETLAFFVCLTEITLHLKKHFPTETVAIIVDHDDPKRMQNVSWAYSVLLNDAASGHFFRALSFENHREVTPLQGADLLVNQVYGHQRDGLVTRDQLRPALRTILGGVHSGVITITPELLRFYDAAILEAVRKGFALPAEYDAVPSPE